MRSQLELLELQEGFKYFMVKVNPSDPPINEPYDDKEPPGSPDLAFWLVYAALGGRSYCSINRVHTEMAEWLRHSDPYILRDHGERGLDVAGQAYLNWAVKHPWSPFGLGFRRKLVKPTPEYSMSVIYHGDEYWRDRRGVLTPTGAHDAGWLSPGEWTERQRFLEKHIKEGKAES